MRFILTSLLVIFLTSLIYAQDSIPSTGAPRKSFGKLSLSFLSNAVYNGRKDTIAVPYLAFGAGYYNKSGIYLKTIISYLAQPGNGQIDLADITAGYNYFKGKWEAGVSGFTSFYNANSHNIRSSQSGGFGLYTGYELGFIKTGFDAGINFGVSTDYAASLSLEHSFEFLDERLEVSPAIIANAGTQNYYGDYYASRVYGRKRKKETGITYTATADVSKAASFRLQDIEFSLPLDYYGRGYHLGFTINYAIPVNPATVSIQLVGSDGSMPAKKTFQESLDNSIYFSAGFSITLKDRKAKPVKPAPALNLL